MSPHFFNSELNVVGTHYRGFLGNEEFIQTIVPGKRIILEREPENPEDKNAVLVFLFDNQKIALGYIKRQFAAILAPILDRGSQYKCYIEKTYRPRRRLEIVINLTTFPIPRSINYHFQTQPRTSSEPLRPKKTTPTGKAFRKIADFEKHRNKYKGKCGIYIIWNNFSKYYYVGQAKDISRRWSEHYRLLSSRTHQNKLLQYDWTTNGGKSFRFDLLELSQSTDLNALEEHWITRLNSFREGYNATPDGQPIEEYVPTSHSSGLMDNNDLIQPSDISFVEWKEIAEPEKHEQEMENIPKPTPFPVVTKKQDFSSSEIRNFGQYNFNQVPVIRKGRLIRELGKEIDSIFNKKINEIKLSLLDDNETETTG